MTTESAAIESVLTVYFEDPFWVGVLECRHRGALTACKVTFGAEPKDFEVYDFFLANWNRLRFSPPVADGGGRPHAENPKRVQRQIARRLSQTGAGTKAQQALALLREQSVGERHAAAKERAREEADRQFALRQQKKREKHRGH